MPRAGFYNDNEYRAYPFIYKKAVPNPALPDATIVDCGIIMGLDSQYDESIHKVWLAQISRVGGLFVFKFDTNAPGVNGSLFFSRSVAAAEWLTQHATASTATKDCATEPSWEGFLVTGVLTDLAAILPSGTLTFTQHNYVLEPARIQSLVKSYLRSISVGNYERVKIPLPKCDNDENESSLSSSTAGGMAQRKIIVNKRCMKGDLKFEEGTNCQIRQIDRNNEIIVGAVVGGGKEAPELCENGGQLPLSETDTVEEGPLKPTSFAGALFNGIGGPVRGFTPPSAAQVQTWLSDKCPGNKIGTTYGWKSSPIYIPEIFAWYHVAVYYTWNNAEWVESAPVSFPAQTDENGVIDDITTFTDIPETVRAVPAYLSGGFRCCEIASTINGVNDNGAVQLLGGSGVEIIPHPLYPNTVLIRRVNNVLVTGC